MAEITDKVSKFTAAGYHTGERHIALSVTSDHMNAASADTYTMQV